MELPGFEIDMDLNNRLLKLQDQAAPIIPGGPHRPKGKSAYFKALAEAWENGQLLSVKQTRK